MKPYPLRTLNHLTVPWTDVAATTKENIFKHIRNDRNTSLTAIQRAQQLSLARFQVNGISVLSIINNKTLKPGLHCRSKKEES